MPALTQNRRGTRSGAERGASLLAAANGHLAVALREQVKSLVEERPGVYRMIGPDGDVVYVGKSIKLRTRLLSYFRADRGEKATEIISAARRIEWEYVPSEFASLLLELHLIQTHHPWFNAQHKSERGFCFIKVTAEEAPRVLLATQVANDGCVYYGPYVGPVLVRNVLRELYDLLQLRDCAANTPVHFADQMELFGFNAAPRCVRADLQKCLAPCAARCTATEYRSRVQQARRFLEGDFHRPLSVLHERMEQAAQDLRFEYAAQLRDRAFRLEGARAELLELRASIETLSFVYSVRGHCGDDRVYIIRRGSVRAELAAPRTSIDEQHLLGLADTIFRKRERGPATVQPRTVAQILLISRWFRARPDELANTLQPDQINGEVVVPGWSAHPHPERRSRTRS
jgi:excinuclease ABC subunit C